VNRHISSQLLPLIVFLVGTTIAGCWGMYRTLMFAGPLLMLAVGIGTATVLGYGIPQMLAWTVSRALRKTRPRPFIRNECPSKPGLFSIN